MSDTLENLREKIERATDLESVVSSMKALAASNIGQYERAVYALSHYYETVELGLIAQFTRRKNVYSGNTDVPHDGKVGAVVFGSDQGLVGQFNDVLAEFVAETLAHYSGDKKIWAVGERVLVLLSDLGLPIAGHFEVPGSVHAITSLVGKILTASETPLLYLFYNKPTTGALYKPVRQRLLPLDRKWKRKLLERHWPTHRIPEILGDEEQTLGALIREYLFVSLFKACAESLASENASRLAAMQRAEKNINEMMDELKHTYHRLRQDSIDSELFDVVAGFEALKKK